MDDSSQLRGTAALIGRKYCMDRKVNRFDISGFATAKIINLASM